MLGRFDFIPQIASAANSSRNICATNHSSVSPKLLIGPDASLYPPGTFSRMPISFHIRNMVLCYLCCSVPGDLLKLKKILMFYNLTEEKAEGVFLQHFIKARDMFLSGRSRSSEGSRLKILNPLRFSNTSNEGVSSESDFLSLFISARRDSYSSPECL